MVTGILFIVYWKVIVRRLKRMFPTLLGQAAAVGENTLSNLLRSYFREWWQSINCIALESGRTVRRGVPY
jgi:hypothetical protein